MNSSQVHKRIFRSLLCFLIFDNRATCFTFRQCDHHIYHGAALYSSQKVSQENCEEEVGHGFVSRTFQVYIEDTDAYGIMYNGNYLKFYDRALHSSPEVKSVLPPDGDWSIVSLEDQKFIGSPSLGSEFVIQGVLKKSLPSDNISVWDLKMTSPDGSQLFNSVSNLSVATPAKSADSSSNAPAFEIKESSARSVTSFDTIHRDELDAHLPGQLPLRIVLNLFERARSNLLGGPDDLKRLQEDHGIMVVVTKISDCTLIDEGIIVRPGQIVHIDTQGVIKRNGMIIDCFQTLRSNCGKRLAQAKITLMMINKTTKRPTSKIPDWVMEKLTDEKVLQATS